MKLKQKDLKSVSERKNKGWWDGLFIKAALNLAREEIEAFYEGYGKILALKFCLSIAKRF